MFFIDLIVKFEQTGNTIKPDDFLTTIMAIKPNFMRFNIDKYCLTIKSTNVHNFIVRIIRVTIRNIIELSIKSFLFNGKKTKHFFSYYK